MAAILAAGLTAIGQRAAGLEGAKVSSNNQRDDFDLTKEAKGKILYLTLKQADQATGDSYTVFVVNARTTRLGGGLMVVGVGYAAEGEKDAWYKDMTIGVPWDNVMAFHIMTEKQYKDFMAAPAEEERQAQRERHVR
jgi:hypothetical protein